MSCSRSTLELIQLAVDAVTVAFRVGKHVIDTAKRFGSSATSDLSWSIIVPGLTSIEALRTFCEETVRILSLPILSP